MIELGLTRITHLLKDTPIPWRAVHVAGTNGKGSVCAYASAILHASNIRCGRFTSPHLIDRWDCIAVEEKTVRPSLFHEVESAVKARDQREGIKASEFEILTATAFEVFNHEKVEVGIVEVGMGGRHDATNVLIQPSVTVISKIGEDHQSFLGDTLEEIAYQKAGIMKPCVPCLVDGSNSSIVLRVLEENAEKCQGATLLRIPHDIPPKAVSELQANLSMSGYEPHQIMNIHLACEAVKCVLSKMGRSLDSQLLVEAIKRTSWPGRLQMLNLGRLINHQKDVLLDGCHNAQSAEMLGSYVNAHLRLGVSNVTWVIGMSEGKDARHILRKLLHSEDNLIAVRFGPVEGMPWVRSLDVDKIVDVSQSFIVSGATQKAHDLREALHIAANSARGGPIVIAGSLYLISDVLRLQRHTIR